MNPLAIVKSTTKIIPTPSKVEITRKKTHSEVVEVEDEDSEAPKQKKNKSKAEFIEDEGKKERKRSKA